MTQALLSINNLSISDHNKVLLGSAETLCLLLDILDNAASPDRVLQLASSCLLQLSFNAEVMVLLKNEDLDAVAVLEGCVSRLTGPSHHNVEQLLWALDEKARTSAAALEAAASSSQHTGHVMMSYSWAHQVRLMCV